MKNEKEKLADDLFKEGFAHHEVPFEPKAWENMKALLDEEDDLKPLLMVPENKSNHKRPLLTILIIMSTLSILSISAWMIFNPNSQSAGEFKNVTDVDAGTKSFRIEDNTVDDSKLEQTKSALDLRDEFTTETQVTAKGTAKNSSVRNTKSGSGTAAAVKTIKATSAKSDSEGSGNGTSNAGNVTNQKDKVKPEIAANDQQNVVNPGKPVAAADSIVNIFKDGKIHRVFVHKTWVPDQYDYEEIDSLRTIQDGFIGVHFTAQQAKGVDSMSAGFNIQFMSGNRLENANWGLYGGFDFGMQFYGSGKKSGVVLNNTSLDSGYTRLRSQSLDFFGRAHLEYAKFPIIPYFNLNAGPRIYYTNQQVSSYVPLKNTESSSSNNAHTSVSMMYGIGAGVRIRVSKVVSLDMRYEWMSGTKVKQVDLGKSTFNGLNYNLVYNKANPTVEQFKVGLLFDLSSPQYRKVLVTPAHYQITQYDSLVLDHTDTNKIILPCNCPCDKTSEYREREDYNGDIYNPDRSHESSGSGTNGNGTGTRTNTNTNSGSGKGAFPGIRPSTPKPTEKKAN